MKDCLVNRLVVFGCSHTYGHGLSDCYDPDTGIAGQQPSLQAWPAQLAKILSETHNLNILVVNKATPGSSNKEIMRNILEFDFEKDDICVVMWSYVDRHSIFQSKENVIQIIPMMNKKWYQKYHTDFDAKYNMWQNINHTKLLLDSLDIANWHCSVDKSQMYNPPKWNNVEVIKTDFNTWKDEHPALDKQHAGPIAHKKQAQELKVIIDAYYK